MNGRKNRRKRSFKRVMVTMLTFVMLLSVCFPGMMASAEEVVTNPTESQPAEPTVYETLLAKIEAAKENTALTAEDVDALGKEISDAQEAGDIDLDQFEALAAAHGELSVVPVGDGDGDDPTDESSTDASSSETAEESSGSEETTTAPSKPEETTTAPSESEETTTAPSESEETTTAPSESEETTTAPSESEETTEPDQDPEITALYNQIMSYTDIESYWAFLDTMSEAEQEALFAQFTVEQQNAIWDYVAILAEKAQEDYAGELPDFSGVTPTIIDVREYEINEKQMEMSTIEKEGRLYVALPEDVNITGYTPVYTWYKNGTPVELTTTVLGGESNVDQYGEWLNVAVDQGSGAKYTVRLTAIKATDGSKIPLGDNQSNLSLAYDVNYSDRILNGDFEAPSIEGKVESDYESDQLYQPHNNYDHDENQMQFIEDKVDGLAWKTTSPCNSIEIISVRKNTEQANNIYTAGKTVLAHGVVTAADGEQLAELNSQGTGALYQDVLTVPGKTMYWQLAHMGRTMWSGENDRNPDLIPGDNKSGKDTMYVVIMPTALAKTAAPADEYGSREVDTQEELTAITGTYGIEDGVVVVPIDYDWKWRTNGQTSTLYDENNTPLYQLTRNRDNTVSTITWLSDPWDYSYGQYEVPKDQFMTRYFFVAGDTANTYNNSVGNHIDKISFSVDPPEPNVKNASLKLTKTLEGVEGLTTDELNELKSNLQFDVKIGTNDSYTVYGSKQNDPTAAVITWDTYNPTVGTYLYQGYPVTGNVGVTITETINGKAGNYKLTKVNNNDVTDSEDETESDIYSVSGQLSGGKICELAFTNTYAPTTTSVTITKDVTGNMGDVNKEFPFTVNITGGTMADATVVAVADGSDGYTIANNKITFNLKDDEYVTIANVPLNAVLELIESNVDSYEVSVKVGNADASVVKNDNVSGNATKSDIKVVDNLSIVVTNHNEAPIDTGITLDTFPMILLFSTVTVLGAVLMIGKKRYEF